MKIYCWIGADISVMSSNIVPKECYTGRRTEARGLLPRVSEFDVANITLEVNGWKEDLQVLVAPPKSLKHSVLLGREPYSQYSPPRHHLVVEKVAHTASINNQVAQPSNIKRLPFIEASFMNVRIVSLGMPMVIHSIKQLLMLQNLSCHFKTPTTHTPTHHMIAMNITAH